MPRCRFYLCCVKALRDDIGNDNWKGKEFEGWNEKIPPIRMRVGKFMPFSAYVRLLFWLWLLLLLKSIKTSINVQAWFSYRKVYQ